MPVSRWQRWPVLFDVRLEKSDHYVLHARGRAPKAEDIQAARGLVRKAMLASALLCVALVR